jgi:hypothetical protein
MRVLKVGERGSAAAAGAIMGGAVGVMLGSALARPAPPPVVYAPPAEAVEEVEPADEVIFRKRPARRVVEIEEDEDAAPRVVQEEECITQSLWPNGHQTRTGLPLRGRGNMSKHFITGAARSVTNSVECLIELRKHHPEWDDRPSEKALARERLLKPRSMPLGGSPGALVRF